MNQWSVVKMDPKGTMDTNGAMAYCFKSPVGMIDFPMLCIVSRPGERLLMILDSEEVTTLLFKGFSPDHEVMAIELLNKAARHMNETRQPIASKDEAYRWASHCLHNLLLS